MPHDTSRIAIANPDGINKFAFNRHCLTPLLSESYSKIFL
ncbi:No hit [Brucella canis HSK A52141]|nr:No hit [Brucella canis HSK A52141]